MVGDGIRNAFTVTGSAGAAEDDDAMLLEATESYQRYVNSQADALLEETQEFVDLVKAGDIEGAKALFPIARTYWERIEPVAESFGDLDPKIDGREDVVEEGMEFTGFHRIERDLWQDGLQPDTNAIADQLMADVTEIVDAGQGRRAQPAAARQRLEGAARRGRGRQDHRRGGPLLAHRPLGLPGERRRLARPRSRRSARSSRSATRTWSRRSTQRFAALDELLEAHRDGDGFKLYTDLTEDEVRRCPRRSTP